MVGVSNTRRLRSLLLAAKDDQRLTLDQIVARSEGRVRRSYANNLTKELYRKHPLSREELTDIAEAFGIDYEVLRQAHLTDMGLTPVEGAGDAAPIALDLPRGVDKLTPRQRSAISAVIRAMIEPESPADQAADTVPVEDTTSERYRTMLGEGRRAKRGPKPKPP